MSLEVDFNVHGIADTSVGLQAEVDGEPMGVTTKCVEVELTSADGRHGSLVLRFIKNAEEAREFFTDKEVVTATFS